MWNSKSVGPISRRVGSFLSFAVIVALLLTGCGASTSASAATTASSTVTVISNAKLGKILADANGMTLYVFDKDTNGNSNCLQDCLKQWPPLMVKSKKHLVLAKEATGQLTPLRRAKGDYQVLFNGMPLYYSSQDTKPGDTNGQGFDKVWWAVAADGSKVIKK